MTARPDSPQVAHDASNVLSTNSRAPEPTRSTRRTCRLRSASLKRSAGFTLVELLIGMSLSLLIMGAVLSSYVFLGRNFARALGISSATEPNLEAQGRRTLAYFTQDVRMASGLFTTLDSPKLPPSENAVTLIMPTGSGSKYVIYYFNDADPAPLPGFTIPKHSIVRIDLEANTTLVLHNNVLTCTFNYYDNSGRSYTNYANYLIGVKQISVAFTSQGGNAANGTQTQIYSSASPRLILRNTPLLP